MKNKLGICEDFDGAANEMDEIISVSCQSLFYELYALLLEAKGKLHEADKVYQMGIVRNAGPIVRLKKAHAAFLDRMSLIVSTAMLPKTTNSETEMSLHLSLVQFHNERPVGEDKCSAQ